MTEKPIYDATTILLLRDDPGDDPFDIFMVRRTKKAKFMANAMVFPGGKLDATDADDALAARCDLDRQTAAKRLGLTDGTKALALLVAGVRETFEEVGVLLATRDGVTVEMDDPAEAARFGAHRDALNAGETTLLAIAEAEDLILSVDALSPYARWITPNFQVKRFDTWFLLARAPAGQHPLHDDGETVASAWLSPKAALDGHEAGDIELAPPTLRVLLELAYFTNARAAHAACVHVPAAVQPQPKVVDGALNLLLPGDPEFDPPGEATNRIIMRDGRCISIGRGV